MTLITPPVGAQNPWERPLVDASPPVSERLVRALEAHIAVEADDAALCGQFAELSSSGAIKQLAQLIVEDARRHQALLEQMVRRLREDTEFVPSPTALAVPDKDGASGGAKCVAILRTLIRDAQDGARYLRHLAHQDAGLYDGYFALLLDTFARDNEKHIHVLRYLLRHAEGH